MNSESKSQKQISEELSEKTSKLELKTKDSTPIEMRKGIANNIDEGAWFVCNKVRELLDSPVDESNELALKERLADIQVIVSSCYNISNEIGYLMKPSTDRKTLHCIFPFRHL